jgi:hypothetical protein
MTKKAIIYSRNYKLMENFMRKPRELIKGAIYHIICRINRYEEIFKLRIIKELFLIVLRLAKKKYKFKVINFCLTLVGISII